MLENVEVTVRRISEELQVSHDLRWDKRLPFRFFVTSLLTLLDKTSKQPTPPPPAPENQTLTFPFDKNKN